MSVEPATPETESFPSGTAAVYMAEQRDDSPVSAMLREPPSYITRGLLYLTLIFVSVSLVYAALSRVDIIRSEPAVVMPEGRIQHIQSDIDGVVVRIDVREGQQVAEGDVLAVIDSKEVGGYLAELRTAEEDLAVVKREQTEVLPIKRRQIESETAVLEVRRAGLLEAKAALERRIADARRAFDLALKSREAEKEREAEEQKRLSLEADNVKERLTLWERELAVTTRLRERGVASQLQFLSAQRSHEEAVATVEKADSLLREAAKAGDIARLQFDARRLEHERMVSELNQQLTQNAKQISAADEELSQTTRELQILELEAATQLAQAEFRRRQARDTVKRNLRGLSPDVLERLAESSQVVTNQSTLVAPTAGTVGKLLVQNEGVGVTRGQTIVTLTPASATLHAEIRVAHRDVGLIKPGLPVRLKFDAFPFAEHGAIMGELTHVIPEAEPHPDGAGDGYYRAYCSLNQDYFRVDGEQIALLPGMTATAEIITEQKTLLELLLQPFAELQKPREATE